MPKISIIIPVYNAQEHLKRCLDSVVNQTLKDIEIICVDDCSTDNSIQILEKYAKKDSRIKLIKRVQNGGESKARNDGLDNVTGEYIAFVDNDDTVDLDFYEKLYSRAKETDADITKAHYYCVNYQGEKYFPINNNTKIEQDKFFFFAGWWTAIYKTSLIKDYNIRLPEKFLISGDLIFQTKALIKANSVAVVDNTFYCHFDRENSGFSKFLSKEKILSGVKAIKIIIDLLNENNIDKISPLGYINLFANHFDVVINLHSHNNVLEYISLYMDSFFEIYEKCALKSLFEDEVAKSYPAIFCFIKNNDRAGFLKYLEQNKTRVQILASNLRFKINKEKSFV